MADTRGVRNNNPGNIERVKGVRWQGQSSNQSGDRRFVVFDAPEDGIRAIARTLITYQDKRRAKDGSKIDTVAEMIERWAPPVENNTDAYAEHVASLLKVGKDKTIDVYEYPVMRALVVGIIAHENGGYAYPESVIAKGLALAGVKPPKAPIAKSRTLQGAKVSSVGAGTLSVVAYDAIDKAQTAQAALTPLSESLTLAKYAIVALVVVILAANGYIAYRRFVDDKKRIT